MNEQTKNIINAFVKTLREMFMIDDAAELDFGIYRIMAHKKAEIETFFGLNDESEENALCRKIEALLAEQQDASVNVAEIRKQMQDRIRMYREDGETMEEINKKPTIIKFRQQLEENVDTTVMLPHILTALNDFFSRYYDKGDFISQRRYMNGGDATYLVPYNGEEVKLHWANADQYYIKTSEAFKNYRFKLKNGKEVEFTLKNAVQLKNNEKEQKDWARKFKLWDGVTEPGEEPAPDFVPVQIEEDGVLHIYFTYELMRKKGNEQKTLNNATYATLADIIQAKYKDDYLDLLAIMEGNDKEELRRHINRYTTKNSSDYFIHKNLGDFLRRELDFYLKNEIMHVSDLDYNNLRRTLAEAKTIKAVGEEIIQMLAGLEDFQKKLWLKKKFVVQSDYCITLDRVPESLYEEICANEEQHEEWKRLFDIESIKATKGDMFSSGKQGYTGELTVQFLKENPHLVLDTAFFSNDFKKRLLASMEDIDAQCDGLLVNSENFQALELLQEKYQEQVKCVYIDPPYNTGGDDFLYKDAYQESSWLSCINDRLDLSKRYFKEGGSIAVSIDIKELDKLIGLMDMQLGDENRKANITIRRASITGAKVINPGLVNISENVVMYSNGQGKWQPQDAYREKGYDDRYNRMIPNINEDMSKWTFSTVLEEFAKSKGVVKSKLKKTLGDTYEDELLKFVINNAGAIFQSASLDLESIGNEAVELYKKSKKDPNTIYHGHREGDLNDYYLIGGKLLLFYKDRLRRIGDKIVPVEKVSDIWDDVLPNDIHNEGGVVLKKGKKPEKLIDRILDSTTKEGELVMDYFAGSATSGAVCLKSHRKFINVEANEYFDSIPLRRIKNTLFGDKSGVTDTHMWKGGGVVKYIRLEQYEDTLNNLYRTPMEGAWYEEKLGADTIGYVMDMQSQQNWMHTDWMANPFGVKMQITHGNEKTEQTIDVVETFNYLLGLNVEKMLWPAEGMQVVMGTTRRGKRTMIIWRNTAQVTDEEVKTFLCSVDCKPFKQIYINGETTLATILDGKLRQTETEFEYRMFPNE